MLHDLSHLGKSFNFMVFPEIEFSPHFIEALDALKQLQITDVSAIYWAFPGFSSLIGITKPALRLTFSEALAKWDLAERKTYVEPLEEVQYGRYKGRLAAHLRNTMTLLSRFGHADLKILLSKEIEENKEASPLLKMMIDAFNDEHSYDIVALHSMPAEMAFVTKITDVLRNHFRSFLNKGLSALEEESRLKAHSGTSEKTCAGRGRSEVFCDAQKIEDLLYASDNLFGKEGMKDINNYDDVRISLKDKESFVQVNMQELILSVNMSFLGNIHIPGSFTLGYLVQNSSCSPPNWQSILKNTFQSMGLNQLSACKFSDIFEAYKRDHPENHLLKIALTEERASKIMYLCHALGRGIHHNIESCRPHLLGFFRYIMGSVPSNYNAWQDLKSKMTKIIGDPFALQARIAMIPDLFHNGPECRKTLTEKAEKPFDDGPLIKKLEQLLQVK